MILRSTTLRQKTPAVIILYFVFYGNGSLYYWFRNPSYFLIILIITMNSYIYFILRILYMINFVQYEILFTGRNRNKHNPNRVFLVFISSVKSWVTENMKILPLKFEIFLNLPIFCLKGSKMTPWEPLELEGDVLRG